MSRKRQGDIAVFSEKWRIIEEAAECAFSNRKCRYSFQSVHHAVFQICQAKNGETLFDGMQEFLSQQANHCAQQLRHAENVFFLEEFIFTWDDYMTALQRIDGLTVYFRNYLAVTHRPAVKEFGEHIFCSAVLRNAEIGQRLAHSVHEAMMDIEKWDVLREYADILRQVEKGALFPVLETTYLEVVGGTCNNEAQKRVTGCTVEEYLEWVRELTLRHEEQVANLLSPNSRPRLRQYMLEMLVGGYEPYLFGSETGCVAMLHHWNLKGVGRVIDVFAVQGNVGKVVSVLTTEVKKMAMRILTERNHPNGHPLQSDIEEVAETLQLVYNCEKLAKLLPHAGDSSVGTSPVLKVLYDAINNTAKFPEKLSSYYDVNVRQANSTSLPALVNDVLSLFRVLRDRDSFELSFRNHLATRIMHATPEALEMENLFIDRMREECGPASVSRLEKMLTDVKDTASLQERLKATLTSSHYTLPLDFRPSVLTAGFWPQYSSLVFALPRSMQTCASVFEQIYSTRHNGRKLTFQLSLGTVGFAVRHAGKTYALTAPTPFVVTLNSLNTDDVITPEELCETSGLSRHDVAVQISTLRKYGLVTTPNNDAASFRFDQSFSSSQTKIRIGTGPHRITKEAGVHSSGKTSLKASHIMGLESAIIRVLKANKAVDHETLCCSVEDTLRRVFVPSRMEIKERVDALIERGFLTRGDRSGMYVYSA